MLKIEKQDLSIVVTERR